MAFTHVDKPLAIGGLTLRNRIFRSGHATGLGAMGISDDFIAYHAARARGGVALSVLELLSVHASSPSFLPPFDAPGMADGNRRLVDVIAPLGMVLFQQIWHGGHNAVLYDGSAPWSASDVPSPYWAGIPPIPMTKAMIDDVVEGFAKAARSLESWGIQGAEVHAGHNYLIQQFLQPSTNRRKDEYGGALENRARFLIEVLEAVRSAVSPSFVVGIRMGNALDSGPADGNELARLIRMVQERGLIDYVSASYSGYYALSENIGGMHKPVGYQLAGNAALREAATVPVMAIGRFRTMEEADQVIRAGDADMIGMTRATIADPELVNKSLTGRTEEVRPCIGCLQDCLGGLMTAHRLGCVVNPAVSHETRLSEEVLASASTKRRVVVVGGGPAGMEAARIAALRGHSVTLFEAEPKLGGTLKLAARAPHRGSIADISVWLEAEVFRAGVDVRLSSYVDADELAAEAPDVVVVATGSLPRLDGVLASNPGAPIRGMDHRSVMSSSDLFYDDRDVAGFRAVLVDDIGHYEPIAAAEHLLARGANVTFVTRHIGFAPFLENTFQNEAYLRRLTQSGNFSLRTRTRVLEISDAGVLTIPTYQQAGDNGDELIPADRVVVVTANRPNRELHDTLIGRGIEVHAIGDSMSPRFLGAAIRDGRNLAARI